MKELEKNGLHAFQLQLSASFSAPFFSQHLLFSSPSPSISLLFDFVPPVCLYPFHSMQDQSGGYYGVSNTLSPGNRLFLSMIDRQ